MNISYQFWAGNLSKNARSVALIRPTSKFKTRKAGLFFRPLMSEAQNFGKTAT